MGRQARRSLILAAAGLVVCAAAQAGTVSFDSYAAKFACGNVANSESGTFGVNGKYMTTVNIHNPHYLMDPTGAPIPVTFFKKMVLAQPQGAPALPPSCLIQERVEADEALAVNCTNIRSQLAASGLPSTGPIEGFVVLLVPPAQGVDAIEPPELDVTALYTGRFLGAPTNPANGVNTWDVENVDFKVVRGDPVLDLCSD